MFPGEAATDHVNACVLKPEGRADRNPMGGFHVVYGVEEVKRTSYGRGCYVDSISRSVLR